MDEMLKNNIYKFKTEKVFRDEESRGDSKLYYIMREELIKRKRKKDRCGWIAVTGLCFGALPLGILFTLDDSNMYHLGSLLTNPSLWIGILLMALSYCYYMIFYKKAEEKYDSLKDELRMRVWNDFLFSKKIEFFEETHRVYGIKLYWK